MKRGILFLSVIFMLIISFPCFADRNTPTIAGFSSDTLIKRGDWRIYRISFVATANEGNFTIYDSLTIGGGSNSNVKIEGAEATSGDGKTLDFTNKPLEGSTGLYLDVTSANVVIEYE